MDRSRYSPRRLFHGGAWPLVVVIAGWSNPYITSAEAKPPQVRFDMVSVVACRDVADEAFTAANPGERLLEAKFEISALLEAGDEQDLTEFYIRMASPQRTLRIVDYAPRTTLASDYTGGIQIEKKQEKSQGIGLAVTGGWDAAKVTGHGDAGKKDTLTTKYELVAPLEPISASGTTDQGFGVYFKLRQSRQTTLEGAKEFQLIFRVPRSWRGDALAISCEARGRQRGLVRQLDEEISCGINSFPVALYLEGDEEAKAVAHKFAATTRKLQRTVLQSRHEIDRRRYPSVLHELGGLLAISEPKIPATWLEQILTEDSPGHSFENRLPEQVRSAASNYLTAKRELRKLTR